MPLSSSRAPSPRAHLRRAGATLLLALAAACGGGDATGPGSTPSPDPAPPPLPTGQVILRVGATWPDGSATAVDLQPSGGGAALRLERDVPRTLPVGSYVVAAPRITDARGHSWTSPQHTQAVTVATGASTELLVTYVQRTGSLVVRLDGLSRTQLPAPGAAGHPAFALQSLDSLSAPARPVHADDTLHGVWPGPHRLRTVVLTDTAGDAWLAVDSALTVTLDSATRVGEVRVDYVPAPSAVQFAATGLPEGAAPRVDAVRAGSPFEATLGARYEEWPRGATSATLRPFERSGARWGSAPAAWAHRRGLDTTITFAATIEAGRLALVPSGLSGDALLAARWVLTGSAPQTLSTPVTDFVARGSYTLRALPVELDEVRWLAGDAIGSASGAPLEVRDSLTTMAVTYAPQRGGVRLTLSGVPDGATAAVRLQAVSGRVITAPGTIGTYATTTTAGDLLPGTYRVIAPALLSGSGVRYRAAADTVLVTVRSGDTAQVAIQYAESPAIVRVLVQGLPTDLTVVPQLTLQAGAQTPVPVSAGAAVPNWPAGSTTARLAPVQEDGARWEAPPVTWTHVAGTDTTIVLQAVLTQGRLVIDPSGLPASGHGTLAWTLRVDGRPPRTGSGRTIDEVPAGPFSLQLDEVLTDGDRWRPQTLSAVAGVLTSPRQPWSASYTRVTGHLSIVTTGLPNGAVPSVRVARPALALLTVTRDSLVRGVPSGTTTVTADTVQVNGAAWAATPRVSTYSFAGAGETRVASITYAAVAAPPPPPPPPPPADGLVTDQVLITQAVQSVQGNVPLVAGRTALLRVVVRAVTSGPSNATVRVRLFHGASLVRDTILTRAGLVPTARSDGTLSSTWNWQLPGSLVQPGLTVIAEADPSQAIADGDRTNNTWPRSGASGSIPEVRTVPAWRPVLVPVHYTNFDRTGNVTAGNAEANYLDLARRTMPLGEVIPTVRAPFAVDDSLPASNGNGWTTILSRINTLRLSEATSTQQFYYGVIPVTYTSGVAGMGYVPGRASVGWDRSGSSAFVAAHEWGHNFSLWHGPCGNPGSQDPSFPHAGGVIGAHGWDVSSGALRPPSNFDLMGYCNAAQSWISDYHWTRALNHRAGSGVVIGATQSLLVSGRIDGSQITLEPAWLTEALRAEPPRVAAATHTLRLLDANGGLLLERPITPERVDHVGTLLIGEAVPVTEAIADRLARIEVRDRRSSLVRGEVARTALAASVSDGRITMTRLRADAARARGAASAGRLALDTTTVRRVLVREATTRRLVGMFDRGEVPAPFDGPAYEWLVSDGVRSWPVERR